MKKIELKGQEIKLVKLESLRWHDGHPMGVEVGDKYQGIAFEDLEVGDCFVLERIFRTSPVLEIISETMFKTKNSVYSLEIITTTPLLEDECLGEIDSIARGYDHYEYGLPLYDEVLIEMKQVLLRYKAAVIQEYVNKVQE